MMVLLGMRFNDHCTDHSGGNLNILGNMDELNPYRNTGGKAYPVECRADIRNESIIVSTFTVGNGGSNTLNTAFNDGALSE
jgi:TPP-dependent 2-oxoacid decarboxylase